jgi:hypothetical protein
MTTLKATLKDGRTLDFLPDLIGEGAMKDVYFTADRQSVVCFYKDPKAGSDPIRTQRLERILGRYNPTLPKPQGGTAASDKEADYYRRLFCWPTSIVISPRFGLVTPVYPRNFLFGAMPAPIAFLTGKEKNGTRFVGRKNRGLLEKYAPAELGTWINYFKLCIEMARAVTRMHTAGLAHSDLSPNNVLVDPTGGRSIVIDIDSLVVETFFAADVAGTKGYIAPEVLSSLHLPLQDPLRRHPSRKTDEHALAVLIYQYLLRRHPLEGRRIAPANSEEERDFLTYGSQAIYCEHPTDTSNRPEECRFLSSQILGSQLSNLFVQAFVDGVKVPERRPASLDWLRALIRTWDLLLPCPNPTCPSQWYVLHDPKRPNCSFCGTKPPRSFPVLKLLSVSRPGQPAVADGQLVVYDKVSLFPWHVSRIFPGPETDRTPQAYCAWHENQWLLINQNLTTLTSPGGSPVPPGNAIALTDGATFRLSSADNGRLAEVQMIRT